MSAQVRSAEASSVGITEPDTFPKFVLQHSRQRGDRPAFREKHRGIWRTWTWRDLADEIGSLAAALSQRGVQRGAHVVLIGDNRPRLYAAMCATQWLGAIAVPLYQDASAEEMLALLHSAQATHVFAENQEQVDKVLALLPHCPSIRCIVYDKDRGMRHYQQPQLVSYDDLLKQGKELAVEKREALRAEAMRGTGDDVAFLFFTSGTTDAAKGVVLTHGALINRARVAAAADGLTDADVTMAYLPLGWIGQNLFAYVQPLVVGYCVCCPESSETLLADMREMGPTCFLAPPRVLETLFAQVSMRAEDAGFFNRALYRSSIGLAQKVGARLLAGESVSIGDRLAYGLCNVLIYAPLRDIIGLSKVRVAYSAGDAVSPDLVMFFRGIGINLKQLYGSTETGFFVAMQRNGAVKPDTVGPAADGVEFKFTPQREILVRSPGLFKEYHRDPEATARACTADGWFHTGDAGYLGDDGHLRIIDRLKYIGALNDGTPYAPKLLENKLKLSPYVREAVVVGAGRDTVCALIDIDLGAVGRWADKRSLSYTGHADLASRDEVYALVAEALAKANADLARETGLAQSQIRRFAILPKPLDADDGVLTRTSKLRRDAIADRYRSLIEAIYEGRLHATHDYGDGATAVIKILDAKTASSTPDRRAA